MTVAAEMLAFLRKLHGELVRHAGGFVFAKGDDLHRHKLGLYCSMIEFAHAIVVLADGDAKIAIHVTFRALLEAGVDLKNLCEDEGYLGNLVAADEEQWRRLYEATAKGENPFLLALASAPDFEEQRAKSAAQLKELKRQGRAPLSIRSRFQRAGMANEYDSIYSRLSVDAHSNSTALRARHVEFAAGDFSLALHRERRIEEFASALYTTAVMLLNAARAIHEEFNPDALHALDGLVEEFQSIRDRTMGQA